MATDRRRYSNCIGVDGGRNIGHMQFTVVAAVKPIGLWMDGVADVVTKILNFDFTRFSTQIPRPQGCCDRSPRCEASMLIWSRPCCEFYYDKSVTAVTWSVSHVTRPTWHQSVCADASATSDVNYFTVSAMRHCVTHRPLLKLHCAVLSEINFLRFSNISAYSLRVHITTFHLGRVTCFTLLECRAAAVDVSFSVMFTSL